MLNTNIAPMAQSELNFLREGYVRFSAEQASTVLKLCRYDKQRDETRAQGHIATLAEAMRRGQWLEKSQLDFARVNGRLIMVNGHHRMHAQIAAGVDILWSIAIHDCADEGHVRSLYYRFDTNLRKRSASNIMSGIGFAEDTGLAKQSATALWTSAQVIADGMKFRHGSKATSSALLTDDRVAICHEYAHEARIYDTFVSKAPSHMKRRLRTASVFAIAMVTLKAEPVLAGEFWRGLAEDDGLTKGDPRKALLTDMQTRSGARGLMTAQMMATARAWNAFRMGKSVHHIKVTGNPVPIDGTQYVVRA